MSGPCPFFCTRCPSSLPSLCGGRWQGDSKGHSAVRQSQRPFRALIWSTPTLVSRVDNHGVQRDGAGRWAGHSACIPLGALLAQPARTLRTTAGKEKPGFWGQQNHRCLLRSANQHQDREATHSGDRKMGWRLLSLGLPSTPRSCPFPTGLQFPLEPWLSWHHHCPGLTRQRQAGPVVESPCCLHTQWPLKVYGAFFL